MRRSAEWMSQLDERIIEHLDDDDSGWATPATMAREFCFTASEDRIEERCRALQDAGLVAPLYPDGEMFELTVVGMLYLDGDLDAETLPRRSRC
jgi:hypothetical protein